MISLDVDKNNIHIGDTLRVYSVVVEGAKTRTQIYEGILISLSGRGDNKMMTVRHIGTGGIGVEKKWPVNAKSLIKIEVKKKAKGVRRSKLYYLRDLSGQQATRV